ncbi:hypothetical protein BKA83DRAFT_4045665, partial [Pisolithus microcarpus]
EGENAETIVSNHIKLLHRYNEAKDATQVRTGPVFGLASLLARQILVGRVCR